MYVRFFFFNKREKGLIESWITHSHSQNTCVCVYVYLGCLFTMSICQVMTWIVTTIISDLHQYAWEDLKEDTFFSVASYFLRLSRNWIVASIINQCIDKVAGIKCFLLMSHRCCFLCSVWRIYRHLSDVLNHVRAFFCYGKLQKLLSWVCKNIYVYFFGWINYMIYWVLSYSTHYFFGCASNWSEIRAKM